jgi:hypothetical protein
VANRLSKLLDGVKTTLVDRNETPNYQPGWTLVATWAAMDNFRQKGGEAVMTLPATPLKCAGAPLKMTFMLRDRLAQAGTLDKSKVTFYSALGNVFGVNVVSDNVLARWKDLGVGVEFTQKRQAIDIGARRATFVSPESMPTEVGYDFLHAVPPMCAPDVVKNSALAWQEGPMAAGGGKWTRPRSSIAASRMSLALATSTARRGAKRPPRSRRVPPSWPSTWWM